MKRILPILLFALGLASGNPVAQAQSIVLCIGDSITEGVYVATPYPTRLANNTGHRVINAGIGGEKAAQGLARIDALLAQHHPCNVLILFGANDVWSPSTDLRSSANSVLQMALRARAAGAMPVIGTTSPFLSPPRRVDTPARVREFNGYVRSLASANGIRLADVYNVFGAGGSGLLTSDGVHPNDAGMEAIARTFAPKLDPAYCVPPPTQPTLLAPIGLVPFSPRPVFSWTVSTNATSYMLTLNRNGAYFHSQKVDGTSWTPTFDLTCASYTWSVAGQNSRGLGPASTTQPIYYQDVQCCIPRVVGDLQAEPKGNGLVEYSWTADACATEYQIWIQRNGATWSTNWHAAAIGGGRARVTLPNHSIAAYRWWVLGRSPDGTGTWSPAAQFSYGVPRPVSPAGRLTAPPAEFAWNDLSSGTSEWYHLWLNRDGQPHWTPWIQRGDTVALDATNRAVALPANLALPYGTYTWWMQAWEGGALGAWSAGLSFTRGQLIPISPSGTVANAVAQFVWDDSWTADATWYQIWINREGALHHERWFPVGDTTALPAQKRGYALSTALPYGHFTWWLRAYHPSGTGPWIQGPSFFRGYAKPIHPAGTTTAGQRTLTWNDTYSGGATWFQIWVNKNNALFWNGWIKREQAFIQDAQNIGQTGAWGTYWSYSLPASVTVTPGTYTWWIQPWVSPASGIWSEGVSYLVPN